MGNARSAVAASLAVCSVYVAYVHIYRSHRLLSGGHVLSSDRLPSLLYLYLKYVSRAVRWRPGCLRRNTAQKKNEAQLTVLTCRLDSVSLRRFCSAAGYGWDYPDTEYRDIPLCFPEFLCGRLILMLLTNDDFRLSPAGLVRVSQCLKTFQPIDELKKGPFTLHARVLVYRQTDAGVEVDICLSAASRSGSPVWESVLTLLSKNNLHTASRASAQTVHAGQPCDPALENMKQVELRALWKTNLLSTWCFSDHCLYQLYCLPVRLFGGRSRAAPSLWMLSVCLAEIEKHKGVDIITAPVQVTAQFKEPLFVPGKVTIRFWETKRDASQNSAHDLSFHMGQLGTNVTYMDGIISRW